MAGPCKYDKESSGPVEDGKFHEKLGNYKVLKKDILPCI
jgi:hypothetical protein